MSVRAIQREATRERIVTAVLDLVADGHGDDIAVPDVSRRSGISLATIYRYFPTKDALLDAAADEPSLSAAGIAPGDAADAAFDGPAYLRVLWRSFEERLPLVRRQAASEAGRELRTRRLAGSRAVFAQRAEHAGIPPDSPEGERFIRLALLLTSSLAFLDLHDRQALAADDAVTDVAWAVGILERASAKSGEQVSERGGDA